MNEVKEKVKVKKKGENDDETGIIMIMIMFMIMIMIITRQSSKFYSFSLWRGQTQFKALLAPFKKVPVIFDPNDVNIEPDWDI